MFERVSFQPKNRSSESGFTWVDVSHVQRLKPEVDVKAVFIDQGKAAKKAGTEGRVYLITKVPGGIDLSPISVEDAKLCWKILERKVSKQLAFYELVVFWETNVTFFLKHIFLCFLVWNEAYLGAFCPLRTGWQPKWRSSMASMGCSKSMWWVFQNCWICSPFEGWWALGPSIKIHHFCWGFFWSWHTQMSSV